MEGAEGRRERLELRTIEEAVLERAIAPQFAERDGRRAEFADGDAGRTVCEHDGFAFGGAGGQRQ